ncbi:MAG: AEC family transporter [Candidatus Omnitrophica bacterium]|nr:AEC family transporter [Candidatus Omnitrophota bacterium]
MMFLESFKITGVAVAQILLVAVIGYFLVKRGILGQAGLDTLSRLVVEVTLPILIFCQLMQDFRFDLYPNWWVFPLLSLAITIAGLLAGIFFVGFIKGSHHKVQFLSLTTFQNSGYLPLALIAAILPKEKADTALVYLFLFLLGFNLIVWSLGVYMLSFHKSKKFDFGTIFSPPVVAVSLSLMIIFLGWHKFVPDALIKPLAMVGDCTLPLAMIVVGGSLAAVRLVHINIRAMSLMVLSRLIILPAIGLWLILEFKMPELLGFLILIELAVPSATSLTVITRHYKNEDLLISQGVFFGHLASLVTLPLFLSIYLALVMAK